jgi:flagellar protein FlbD
MDLTPADSAGLVTYPNLRFASPPPITDVKAGEVMIELTRLNGNPLVLNAELIKFVEQNPDTVITLLTGDKMVVRESAPEVMHRVLTYRRILLSLDTPSLQARSIQFDSNVETSAKG